MKKLILYGIALMSYGFVNAQGWSSTGAHDDFATSTEYSNGPEGQGLYWFDLTGGTSLSLSRPGDGALHIDANNAGGCAGCYPVFGVQFGTDESSNPYLLDLSGDADITLDIENTTSDFSFMSITLEDVNGNKSEYEPNVSDLTPSSTWGDPERKSLNGFTLYDGDRQTITIDLSSVPTAVGGLSQNGPHDCDPGPYNCPPTSYQIDPTKIKTILFTVNFGVDNIFLSEGDGDYTADTFIEGVDITPIDGVIKIHDFVVGNFVVTANQDAQVEKTLNVFPNPAKDVLNVAFESNGAAEISLSDVTGYQVYAASSKAGQHQVQINTSGLAKGLYILNVATENGKVSKKVAIE